MFGWTTPLRLPFLSINDDAFLVYDNPLDGSSKKKQAEQQAAKIALQHLSGIFKWSMEPEAGKSCKVFLKERLDALHLKNPVYRCKVKGGVSEELEGPSTSGDNLHCEFDFIYIISVLPLSGCKSHGESNTLGFQIRVCFLTAASCTTANSKNSDSISLKCLVTQTQDASTPEIPSKSPKLDYTGTQWFVFTCKEYLLVEKVPVGDFPQNT